MKLTEGCVYTPPHCAPSPPAAALCARQRGRQGQDNHPDPDVPLKQDGQELAQEEYLSSVSPPELPAVSAATEVILKMLISTALLIMGLKGGFFWPHPVLKSEVEMAEIPFSKWEVVGSVFH